MLKKLFFTCLCYGLVLIATNVIHFRYFPVNVVLYGALLDVVIALLITAPVSWFFIFKRQAYGVVFAQQMVILVLLGYIAAITIPTIIDRSYSMYILQKLEQQGGGLQKAAFGKPIFEEFNREHRLDDVRLTEQLESGTVMITDDCVHLTPRGERIASFTRWYRMHLLPPKRLLMGEYSDDLTDPFRQPSQLEMYRCTSHVMNHP